MPSRPSAEPIQSPSAESIIAEMAPQGLKGLQFVLEHLKPEVMSGRRNYEHLGLDLGCVLSGALNLEVQDRHDVLVTGDSFCFTAVAPTGLKTAVTQKP